MKLALSVALLLLVGCVCDAKDRRYRRYVSGWNQPQAVSVSQPSPAPVVSTPMPEEKSSSATKVNGSDDALAEVNAERAKRGLQPLIHDPLLTQGALACAKARAASQIHGHLSSDFDYLPSGAQATAAGCGALEPSWGWGTCCTYDNYTYGGAAWVMGSDGRRYMHLFVR
ncbi:MAG: hypothetical protein JNJ77_17425 [Planctomycetia bacterium]|nr:hypothetical protein [Planctomycetia bacterium]